MGRGVKSVSKKKPMDLCSLQVWSSPWSAQRRDGFTIALFHEKSCGAPNSAPNILSMWFMCKKKKKMFLEQFLFYLLLFNYYSNPNKNNWDLGFSDLTSVFYFFFSFTYVVWCYWKTKNFRDSIVEKFIFSFEIINNLVKRRVSTILGR